MLSFIENNLMPSGLFEKTDDFLAKSDHESMDWCDGGDYEIAESYLNRFDEDDWNQLKKVWRDKSAIWQGCLTSVLYPHYGSSAQELLIEIAGSKNGDLAFQAMSSISFYCGISANSQGSFLDESIAHQAFIRKLRSNSKFVESIPQIGILVGRRYDLLQGIMRGEQL